MIGENKGLSIALIYFSGTGHTRLVAEEYKKYFMTKTSVTLFDVAETEFVNLKDFDLVGILYPIHAFNPPQNVYDFVKRNDFSNAVVFISKNSGEPLKLNDGSSNRIVKKIESDGGQVLSELHVLMPYNILKRHTREMASKMFHSMQVLVSKHCEELSCGKRNDLNYSAVNKFVSWLLRLEWKGANIIGKGFKTNDLCVKCLHCEEICPNNNISHDENGIRFGENCSLCMRCAFHCPHNAIEIGILKRWKVNGQYDFQDIDIDENDLQAFEGIEKKYDFYKEYFDKVDKIEKNNLKKNEIIKEGEIK